MYWNRSSVLKRVHLLSVENVSELWKLGKSLKKEIHFVNYIYCILCTL